MSACRCFGGAINLDGLLRLQVTRTGNESTLGKVIALTLNIDVAEATRSRGCWSAMPGETAGVGAVAGGGHLVCHQRRPGDARGAGGGMPVCAGAVGASYGNCRDCRSGWLHGILIRSSAFLEELADLTSLVVDKTGTLTFGTLRLQSIETSVPDRQGLLNLAASLGSYDHPVSRALAGLATTLVLVLEADVSANARATDRRHWADRGRNRVGRWNCSNNWVLSPRPLPNHDGPIAGLALNERFLAWLLLADSVKPEARQALDCGSWAWAGNCCSPATARQPTGQPGHGRRHQ